MIDGLRRAQGVRRLLTGIAILGALLLAISNADSVPGGGGTAPYDSLTNNRHDVANLNVESVNPMTIDPQTLELFAVNTHGSQLLRWDLFQPQLPPLRWQTLWNPVTVRLWEDRVLVVGGGTHALAAHNRTTGKIVQLLELPSEPADLVIDPDGRALVDDVLTTVGWGFVACQGADTVVKIRLDTFEEINRYDLPAERPRFLSFDRGDELDLSDNKVYVAPMISGNNTTFVREEGGGVENDFEILDLNDPSVAPGGGLPDEDLFCIDTTADTVTPVVRSAGSILFEHATNPVTKKHWMLAIDSHNAKHPVTGQQVTNEPELKGVFASNSLKIVDSLGSSTPIKPQTEVSLDQNAPTKSCSTPYAMAFTESGYGFIASSTGDVVSIHDPNGVRLINRPLPRGSIPRDLLLLPGSDDFLIVYCWGSNKIQIYRIVPWIQNPILTLDLGHDPTPPSVKVGRTIWYDADRSQNAQTTCNHCHVAGAFDALAWPLAGEPNDFKDAMVTQSLLGIEDSFPYHWRGERDLLAFNDAFVGLLGGPRALMPNEFEDFQEFVFSLQGASNPRQNFRRELDNGDFTDPYPVDDSPGAQLYPPGRPVEGQILYQTPGVDGSFSCVQCHQLPSGTRSDVMAFDSVVPLRQNIEIPHFRDLTDRNQDMLTVSVDPSSHPSLNSNSILIPRLGFGMAHNGQAGNIFQFIRDAFQVPGGLLDDQGISDITAFIESFDEGISPAIHTSRLVRQDTLSTVNADILELLDQAGVAKRWIDLIAMGTIQEATGAVEVRWTYDPSTDLFNSNQTGIGPWAWSEFATKTAIGEADHVFMGVPAGHGAFFGIDSDGDGKIDGEDPHPFSPLSPDVNANSIPDGWEGNGSPTFTLTEDFGNLTLQKYDLIASEPVQWHVEYQSSLGGPVYMLDSLDYALSDTIVLQHLSPSVNGAPQTYSILEFKVIDYEGNQTFGSPTPFTTPSMFVVPGVFHTIVGDLSWEVEPHFSGGDVLGTAKVRVDWRGASPPGVPLKDHVVIAQVLYGDRGEQPQVATTISSPSGLHTSFKLDDLVYSPVQAPGPFLVSLPSADQGDPLLGHGEVRMDFRINGPVTGQEVTLNVFAIFPAKGPKIDCDPPTDPLVSCYSTYDPADPNFTGDFTHLWTMFATPSEFRRISKTL